jgi:hypothetical protein
MDIEGDLNYPVEVALILFDREKQQVIQARVFYGQVYNINEYRRGRSYSHGMCRYFLDLHGSSKKSLFESVHQLIQEWHPSVIAAFGLDCYWFLKKCGIRHIPFKEIRLPPWAVRCLEDYHKKAFHMKLKSAPIGETGTLCPFVKAHPFHVKAKTPEKREHGAHCALYDCAEIVMFDNPNLIDKL